MRFPATFFRLKGAGLTPLLGSDDTLPTSKSGEAKLDNVLATRIVSINGWPLSRVALVCKYSNAGLGVGPVAALPVKMFVWEDAVNWWVQVPGSAATVAAGLPEAVTPTAALPTFFDAMSLIDFPHVSRDLEASTPGTATFLCVVSDPGGTAPDGRYDFALGPELTTKPF